MKLRKSTIHGRADIRRLYDDSERLEDVGSTMTEDRQVEFEIDDRLRLYALPERLVRQLDQLARRRRTTPQKLIERWVREKLAEVS